MTSEAMTRTFRASCHCKSSNFTFALPTTHIPIKAHFCHCSICRYTHGTPFTLHAPIPQPDVDLSTFTTYESTPGIKKYFCTTCGAHMLDHGEEDDDKDWYVAVCLVHAGEEVWQWKGHYFVGSTVDGGVAVLLREVEVDEGRGGGGGGKMKTKKLPLHDTWGKKDEKFRESGDWKVVVGPLDGVEAVEEDGGKQDDDKLLAQCHCGGVSFLISRPTGPETFKYITDKGLVPQDTTKWFGSFDACDSCRLVCSTPIIAWIFPTPASLSLLDGSAYPANGIFGTAKQYSTSPGVNRTFCGTCGATVTYGCDDRLELVDVAAGLLRAPRGVRAEDWVEWRTWKVSYEEDARFKGLVGGLRKALQESGEHGEERVQEVQREIGKERL